MWGLLADAVLVLHLGFVLFVALGALLVSRWPRLAWLHLPAVAWGAGIELSGGVCPLTPLENAWRARAGEDGYSDDFVAAYLVPLIYPEGLTRGAQVALGLAVLAVNVALYVRLARRRGARV